MTLPRITSPIVFNNLKLDRDAVLQQEIEDNYKRTIAHMVGLDGSDLNIAKIDACGKLLSGGIDRLTTPSQTITTATVNGRIDVDLGGVYNFHTIQVRESYFYVEFSTDDANFVGRTFADRIMTNGINGTVRGVLDVWATCSSVRIDDIDLNSNQSVTITSFKC